MNNNELPENQNLWAIEEVKKFSGKSTFEIWSPDKFSEFLIVMMRYGNLSLFSQLATILKPNEGKLGHFLAYAESSLPLEAVAVLADHLLMTTPDNWNQRIFNEYLDRQIAKLPEAREVFNEPNRAFGKIETRAYLLHVETDHFRNQLNDPKLHSQRFHSLIKDWREIIDQNPESKNQYLRKNILEKIINRAVVFQKGLLVGLTKEKSDIDISSRNNTISILSEHASKHINDPILDILWKGLDSFSREQFVNVTTPFFKELIALNRTNYAYCERNIWPLIAKAYGITEPDTKNVMISSARRLWLKEQIRTANTIYGNLRENDD